MEKKSMMVFKDIPLSRLTASNPKKFSETQLVKIRKSMETIGMTEPLCVFDEKEKEKDEEKKSYLIVDGNKRYIILLGAGIASAPCILIKQPDTYTASYHAIGVSPAERRKMLRKVLEKVSEEKIAAAIGVSSLKPGLEKKLLAKLNPAVILAYDQGLITKNALLELQNVTPKRQAEILKEFKQAKNYGIDVVRSLVLGTPSAEQVPQTKKSPWKKSDEKRDSIARQLEELEKRSSLMSHYYHTYVSDVTQQLTYIRAFLKDPKIEQYIAAKYPEVVKTFYAVMERE